MRSRACESSSRGAEKLLRTAANIIFMPKAQQIGQLQVFTEQRLTAGNTDSVTLLGLIR